MQPRYLIRSVLFIASACFYSQCHPPTTNGNDEQQESTQDTIPLPVKTEKLGNHGKVFYIDGKSILQDTLVNGDKRLRINGDLFLHITGDHFPLYIYTSLMQLEVISPSAFRISAYDKDQGQSVESLSGEIRIAKNYDSPFPEPDTLRENNLYMINRSIDLSEKENLDDDKLAQWWKRVGN
ncbi:hypothetical protein GCM10023231_02200 [Olivibacter ginsenosidimutans]|uniref:DUF4369 domain-containing protein n=1 Tax=Olivibacter ginsenosidimutans TaxID=1176537 RepID=A0ABP9ADI2_9SPHI